MTAQPQLETIVGDLRASAQFKPGTFRHADELMNERRTAPVTPDGDLRDQWHYTADGHGYFPIAGDVEWAITREPDNLILRHIDDAFTQLTRRRNYRPANEEALAAKTAVDTLVVRMSQLHLSGTDEECGKEFRYLGIITEDGFIRTPEGEYQAPNAEEQKVLTRLGYTPENLRMLCDSSQNIRETTAWVLNPAYVLEEPAKDTGRSSLWRASWLLNFINGSYFYADVRNVDSHYRVRGVRRVVEARSAAAQEGVVPSAPDAPLEITPARCYEILLADPAQAVAALDDRTAAGLSSIVTRYLANRAQ